MAPGALGWVRRWGSGTGWNPRIWEISSNQNDSAIPTHQALQSQPRQKLRSSPLGSIPAGTAQSVSPVLDLGTVLTSQPRGHCCSACPRFGNLEVLLCCQQHRGALPGSWCLCQLPGELPRGTTPGRNGSSPSPGRACLWAPWRCQHRDAHRAPPAHTPSVPGKGEGLLSPSCS